MRKAVIVIFLALLVSIAGAAENESAENEANDLPVIEDFAGNANEAQAEISDAPENESIGNSSFGNTSDLPVIGTKAGLNESQTGNISNAESMEDAAGISSTNIIKPTIESSANLDSASTTGKKSVTASFGVYLQIAG